ncbi:MAG: beta-galactosidase, partial [bacterium]|nr:beta-galactosidase [bacterium]
AVILWHISNEFSGDCHCPLCQKAFQTWLQKKYGSIEVLNEQWNTSFWSHQYQNFEQVESPSSLGESGVHGLNLDWKRFVTDQTIDFMKVEIAAIRESGSKIPVTTNMMYEYRGLNYAKFVNELDVISWDTYPTWHKDKEAETAEDTAMQHDWFRAMKKGQPFLLMESSPSSTNWQPVSKLRRPGMVKQAALQAIAHGSDSSLYFQMRQSRGAMEKFHGALIDHSGECDTRVFEEAEATGKILENIAEVSGSVTYAQAALIYDMENIWAMEDAQGPRNQDLGYKATYMKCYHALRRMGLDVDVISLDAPLEDYQIVVAPMLYLYREEFATKVEHFVNRGGSFLLTHWSGIVNENDLCYLGERPHGLTEVMGFETMEIDALYDGETNRFHPVPKNSMGFLKSYSCSRLCEILRGWKTTPDMEVLMVYGEDFYAGMPVLTRHSYGAGKAYAVLAEAEKALYEDLIEKMVREKQQLRVPFKGPLPEGVEVCTRRKEDMEYLFLQNFGKDTCHFALRDGQERAWEVLYEEQPMEYRRGSSCRVQAGETVILKRRLS